MGYESSDAYFKRVFGKKMFRLSLDAGMTCPNRDGTLGTGGCIFCSANGSGDFAARKEGSLSEQLETAKQRIHGKLPKNGAPYGYLAYFQSFTNTYAPVDRLQRLFSETISHPEIEGLIIATRPDCLPEETLALLARLREQKPVFVELGFQTAKSETISYINRCYPNSVFAHAVLELNKRNLPVTVHCILGLPYETYEDMLETVTYVCSLPIHGIKLQLLHVLRGTPLASDYPRLLADHAFCCMERDAYLDIVLRLIQHIPAHIVIHRLTGDGPKAQLIAPLWSGNKKGVLNALQKEMKLRNIKQGELSCKPNRSCFTN